MFIDFLHADTPAELSCDLCIVGAGAAGITMASALTDSGLDVCVVESGGFAYEQAAQELYDGESIGMQNASPIACRVRSFGGTTNRWQGWCGTLQDVDFAARAWVPHSGWPISRRDLEPFYAAASRLCEIAPEVDETDATPALPAFDTEKIGVAYWRYSPPTNFGTTYRSRLAAAKNVSVLLHCNAVKLETNAGASAVTAMKIAGLWGKTGHIRASMFVLACGGIENTRLLLLTNEVERAGLGNRSGLLGRCFTQHIETVAAQVHTVDAAVIAETFARQGDGAGATRAHLVTSPAVQRAHGLLNTGFCLGRPERHSSAYSELRDIWRDLSAGDWPGDFGGRVLSVVRDFDSVTDDVLRKYGDPPHLNLNVYSEQAPNEDSVISLGAQRDVFALPKVRVDWQLTSVDRRSILISTQKIAAEIGRLNLGRVRLADWLVNESLPWPQPLWGGCHHIGTTRMSHTAETGVVNADCRLHDVDNLYVAGSSVFPTGGYMPPTLTIVALALRLADHLRKRHG